MKVAIVKLSTIIKNNHNLSAGFYLAEDFPLSDIHRREALAARILKNAKELRRKRKNNQAKVRRMMRCGEVTRIV